ncbi:MAG: saccharopine dehydrogenase NADP-binding domain-containing protein [Thermoanaerobaculia bacterium]|nr:saccharopine dehydrogenase NADP-binding domain-containing protein [Thermoanaerobaculia bacterium]
MSAARGGRLLVYGANGYTGELVAREATRRGLEPLLAGRDAAKVGALAAELGCDWRAFPLDDAAALSRGLAGVAAVLHCAGPFSRTSRPMVDACLAAGAHYLDITGEIAVFEAIFRRGDEAGRAGVALLPGVGFDVVPSDALAAELARGLPGAVALDLAFANSGSRASRGTTITALERIEEGGAERRGGRLVPSRLGATTMEVDFPELGRRTVMAIPWGDLATAWRTTGIPDLRTFMATTPAAARRLRRLRPLLRLLGFAPLKRAAQAWVRRRVVGPDAAMRARGRVHLWGRARSADGRELVRALSVPEGYAFTAAAAVEAARRALAGEVAPGAWTPTQAFGRALLDAVAGVHWHETPSSSLTPRR